MCVRVDIIRGVLVTSLVAGHESGGGDLLRVFGVKQEETERCEQTRLGELRNANPSQQTKKEHFCLSSACTQCVCVSACVLSDFSVAL